MQGKRMIAKQKACRLMLRCIQVSTSLKSDLQMADLGFLLLETVVRETRWLLIQIPRDWFQLQQNSSFLLLYERNSKMIPAVSDVSVGSGCENAHHNKKDKISFFLNQIQKVLVKYKIFKTVVYEWLRPMWKIGFHYSVFLWGEVCVFNFLYAYSLSNKWQCSYEVWVQVLETCFSVFLFERSTHRHICFLEISLS